MKRIVIIIGLIILAVFIYKISSNNLSNKKIENYFNDNSEKQKLILAVDLGCNPCVDKLRDLQGNVDVRKEYDIFISPREGSIKAFFQKENLVIESFNIIKNEAINDEFHSGIVVSYPSFYIFKNNKIKKIDSY